MATRNLNRAIEEEETLIVSLGGIAHVDKAVFFLFSKVLDIMIWIVVLLLKGICDVIKDRVGSNMSEYRRITPSMMNNREEE
jgi:hypothetical protein